MIGWGSTGGLTESQVVLIVSSVVLFGITLYYNIRRTASEKPKEWQKVGVLTELMCFPIKSCGVIKLQESDCAPLGLKIGMLRDRVFMVVNHEGMFVTGRTIPKLTQIHPIVDGTMLILKANGMSDISIDISKLSTLSTSETSVWSQAVKTIDCGDDVSNWLSQFLLNGDQPNLRLVYYPSDSPSRPIRPKNTTFSKCTSKDVGALPDATSYNLVTEASLEELNSRLKEHVSLDHFRGNFIVRGTEPYAEDDWQYVRIGSATFQNVKPCTRCLFTTVDPKTGTKNLEQEPLKTLKMYRKITDPELVPFVGDSPVFGIHLALREPGHVKVGDSVFVK